MTRRHPAWVAAPAAALALVLMLVLGVSPAMAARDRTPPTTPTNLRVTATTSYTVSLAWTPSQDDGPYVFYTVFKDGSPVIQGSRETSATITALEPETTHTFTVQARDNGINWSPLSNAVSATTEPRNSNDTTPPTTPANLTNNGMTFQDGETWLFWARQLIATRPAS